MRNANPGTRKIFTILYVGLSLLIALLGLGFRGHAPSRRAAPGGTEQVAPTTNPDPGSSSPQDKPTTVRNG